MYPCIVCSEPTKVIGSQVIKNKVRRRRKCEICDKRFTTVEIIYSPDNAEPTPTLPDYLGRVEVVADGKPLKISLHILPKDIDILVRMALANKQSINRVIIEQLRKAIGIDNNAMVNQMGGRGESGTEID